MTVTKRTIAIQSSKLDARLSVTRRQGSPEAFRLQLASLGEALAANADVSVALEYMREAAKDKMPTPPKPMICAIMDTTVRKQNRNFAR